MRDYSKVSPQFWHGKTGRALKAKGPEAVIVALYLMTCQHANMLGLYHLNKAYIPADTGLTSEGASKGLAWACEAGFCRFDEDTEVVWVMEMAQYQIGSHLEAKDLRCKGVQREYDALPDNPYLTAFYERYSQVFHMTRMRSSPVDNTSPFEAPSKPLRSQEQEQEQEQELRGATSNEVACARPSAEPPALTLVPPKPTGPPDCPHQEILALWAEVLPSMPQHLPSLWAGARADHLRARWRETATAKGWESKEQGLAYFRKFFGYCGTSRFLTGRTKTRDPDQRPFVAELEWLVKPSNWAKVHEGKYHSEEAA